MKPYNLANAYNYIHSFSSLNKNIFKYPFKLECLALYA